jgi:hypothetical protein
MALCLSRDDPCDIVRGPEMPNFFDVQLANQLAGLRLAQASGVAIGGSPDDFGKLITDETRK